MESNFVLLGLIILTVACIYLFYTSFQKNREYDALVEQVNLLRTRDLSREAQMSSLYQQKQQPQHQTPQQPLQQSKQENLQNVEPDDMGDNKLNLEVNIDYGANDNDDSDNNHQSHELTEEKDGEVVDLTEPNNELLEQLDIELDESELNEINNLDELDELSDLNVAGHNQSNLDGDDSQNNVNDINDINDVNDVNDVNDDVASLIESVLLEPSDNNINDLDSVEELDDVNTSGNDTQYLNMSQENLDNMTLKELKLMCKNLDLKSKGNKDELIERVQEKLKQN
jgi:hypothetical protein